MAKYKIFLNGEEVSTTTTEKTIEEFTSKTKRDGEGV